jgi:integrase
MASVGIRKRVSARTGRVTYQVWWLLDDGSQGAQTVSSKDEARDLVAQKRLGVTRGAWQGLQRGRLPFGWWAEQWWEVWAADPDRSPTTLAVTESRLRLYVRPWFGERPIKRIGPADIRRWQAHLASSTGHATLMQCRSLVLRILQFAVDEGAIDTNPVRKVPSPRRRADPEQVLDQAKRRALTPEEAGRLLAQFPLFWWDHVLCLLGTGLRFGELAGLRRRRVHLNRALPVLQVVDTRYQAGRFGSGFKPRPKSDAGIRELSLAPQVVEAIRRQLPPGTEPSDLVFTGPGGGPGRQSGAGVPKGARTVLSRHNFHRTYHTALAKLADPTGELRPTAARILKALRARGPQTLEQLTATLADHGRAIRPATIQVALAELVAAELVAGAGEDGQQRWLPLPTVRDPLLDAVDLHGAHDFRHTFATWLEDAGIPARVIDEVMGHEATSRTGQQRGSAMGTHYRHTTPEMAARVIDAIQQRLVVVLQVAEWSLENNPNRSTLRVP